ncbi:hypothetical protein [Streptomyces parvulus]
MAEEVDGVGLEAEPDVGVDGGGDADVGVGEEVERRTVVSIVTLV